MTALFLLEVQKIENTFSEDKRGLLGCYFVCAAPVLGQLPCFQELYDLHHIWILSLLLTNDLDFICTRSHLSKVWMLSSRVVSRITDAVCSFDSPIPSSRAGARRGLLDGASAFLFPFLVGTQPSLYVFPPSRPLSTSWHAHLRDLASFSPLCGPFK